MGNLYLLYFKSSQLNWVPFTKMILLCQFYCCLLNESPSLLGQSIPNNVGFKGNFVLPLSPCSFVNDIILELLVQGYVSNLQYNHHFHLLTMNFLLQLIIQIDGTILI